MRLAIVHDYLVQMGGAEKVIETLHSMYPTAPIFTSAYVEGRMPPSFRTMPIQSTFMQRLPALDRHFRSYLPLYPLAFRNMDLSAFDVVLASSSGWAHGVPTRPGQTLICYCYTPARWLWDADRYLAQERRAAQARSVLRPVLASLRKRDLKMALLPDRYVAISHHIARRIKQIYRRPADVVYPPVETARFALAAVDAPEDYYLVVSRLVPYKRIDLVIDAFNRLGLPLKIAGSGSALPDLQRRAGPSIEFLGRVSDEDLPGLMARCRALIFPGEEDFGITPVETMATGRPVIAYGAGGALETIQDGVTGVFMADQSPAALEAAIRRIESLPWDSEAIRTHARRFDQGVFIEQLSAIIEHEMQRRDQMSASAAHSIALPDATVDESR